MSYGYMIAATTRRPELTKIRGMTFTELDSKSGLYFYIRLSEGDFLTLRHGDTSDVTEEGLRFFGNTAPPYYLMDFLMEKKQGDLYMAQRMLDAIGKKSITRIHISVGSKLRINRVYEVCT